MRDKNAPRITIGGGRMVKTPSDLTSEQVFSNFEELARGASVGGSDDRLKLIRALHLVGDLLGVLPELSIREALFALEQISHNHECNHALRMALIEGAERVEDLVEAEEARLEAEAESKSGEGAAADGSSETATGPKAIPDEGQGSSPTT